MQKVICISNGKFIEVGNVYYISLTSICSDSDGEWTVNVYEDNKQDIWVGRYRLDNFKSVI